MFYLANNKKSNIQSSVWATLMKLGRAYVGSDGHKYYPHGRHLMRIFNTSFAYLFSLAYNKKGKYPEFCMGHSDETWYVGCGGHKYYPPGVWSPTSFVYMLWLANKKKGNYPRESSVWATLTKLGILVVSGSGGTCITHVSVITECAYLIPHLHICYNKKEGKSPPAPRHFTKGGPRCTLCEYSECVSREPRNSSVFIIYWKFDKSSWIDCKK